MSNLQKLLDETRTRREADAKRFKESDSDLCMMCHAYGADKRSLFVSCFYNVQEAVPEFIDTFLVEGLEMRGHYLRICKSCRARFLSHLRQWATECRAWQEVPKDHDGHELWDDDPERNIPVRINGVTVMLDQDGYERFKKET